MSTTSTTRTIPPSLSHFVIFNPTLKPNKQDAPPVAPSTPQAGNIDSAPQEPSEERDKDLEDDLKEAAQILFYTSRSSKTVSRDTMLKQTGLIKGLMGFSDMLIPSQPLIPFSNPSYPRAYTLEEDEEGLRARGEGAGYLSIKSVNSRMIVWQPEPDFFIYVNVTLGTVVSENGKKDPAYTAQGLSDRLIVQSLERGYEDFRLLHGPLPSLLPPSPALSSTLERFWTKFAFTFENDVISPPPLLSLSLPPHTFPDAQTAQGVKTALDVFVEDSELSKGTDYGIINPTGPLHASTTDPALYRFLTNLVISLLPPPLEVIKPDSRHSLGIGRRDPSGKDRKTSWGMNMNMGSLGTWVPSLSGLTPRSLTPVPSSLPKEQIPSDTMTDSNGKSKQEENKETKSKWSFGIPSMGLGDTFGSVGGVFGLGGSVKATSTRADAAPEVITSTTVVTATDPSHPPAVSETTDTALSAQKQDGSRSVDDASEQKPDAASSLSAQLDRASIAESVVSQTTVDVEDLQSAVAPLEDIDLGWEKRNVHVKSNSGVHVKRRLNWVIRENVLLFILHPENAQAPYDLPSSQTVLALYSRLSGILSSDKLPAGSSDSPLKHSHHANSIVVISKEGQEISGPEVDSASSASLSETKDLLHRDNSLKEVYARTSQSRFIISKRLSGTPVEIGKKGREVHMLVGRKDASLTDAEQAMRSFLRSRQDISV